VPFRIELESHLWHTSLGSRATRRRLALLRPPSDSRLDTPVTQPAPASALSGTASLPNPFPAHLLDHVSSMALSFSGTLSRHCNLRICPDRCLLAKPARVVGALFIASICHRA